MKRKCLSIGIILLFVGVTIAPAIAQNTEKSQSTSRGDWLYVGGSGLGNYTKIQVAIDDALPGSTIYVYHGTYYEHIIINKTINLIGEDRNTTIIDGVEYYIATIWITTNEITDGIDISGFTIRNGGRGLFIFNNDALDKIRNISIHDNIITLNDEGIGINGCTNTTIFKNVIRDNRYKGLYILRGQNISYTQNIIKNNYDGITCSGGDLQKIEKNTIEDNNIGILIFSGKNNVYTQNIIKNNYIGISNEGPYSDERPELQRIEKNTIENNDNGIMYQLYSQNSVISNNFINNDFDSKITRPGFNLFFDLSDFLRFILWAHKTKWDGNYWDAWQRTIPKPVGGFFILEIAFVFSNDHTIMLPLGIFPYIKFDWHPAKEPYDIPEMS